MTRAYHLGVRHVLDRVDDQRATTHVLTQETRMNPALVGQERRLDPKGHQVSTNIIQLTCLGPTEHHPCDAVFRFDETVQTSLITADGLKVIPTHFSLVVRF